METRGYTVPVVGEKGNIFEHQTRDLGEPLRIIDNTCSAVCSKAENTVNIIFNLYRPERFAFGIDKERRSTVVIFFHENFPFDRPLNLTKEQEKEFVRHCRDDHMRDYAAWFFTYGERIKLEKH